MNALLSVFVRNNLRMRLAVFLTLLVTLICALGVAIVICVLLIGPATESAVPDISAIELYSGLIVYAILLFGLGIGLNAFAFPTLSREKSRGVIESLLATPLKVKELWFGKSLAVFLPGFILWEVLALVALLVLNLIYFLPGLGFVLNWWSAFSTFLALPLVYFVLGLLVHLVGLAGKPSAGNLIAQIFFPFFASLMLNLAGREVLDFLSWPFFLANLGLASLILVVIFLLLPRLRKEGIVLSR